MSLKIDHRYICPNQSFGVRSADVMLEALAPPTTNEGSYNRIDMQIANVDALSEKIYLTELTQ